ncbi:hypothetical protein J4447_04750 [Candidatus Pacearchaeota archaeon]|nr:hypothetical protein [Candidatus Pacearchaeota archaeon]
MNFIDMKNKRGTGHLEAILAALIFISFVFVLFYFIKPFETKTESNTIEILKVNLPDYLKANLSKVGLNVEEDIAEACFSVPISMGSYTAVFEKNGSLVSSKATQNNLFIYGARGFYDVYISDEFPDSNINTAPCSAVSKYRLSVTRKVDALSYSKILALNKTYWENYEKFRDNLRVSKSSDFGFIVMDDRGNTLVYSLRTLSTTLNIKADEIIRQMLYSNGTLQNVKMRIYSY